MNSFDISMQNYLDIYLLPDVDFNPLDNLHQSVIEAVVGVIDNPSLKAMIFEKSFNYFIALLTEQPTIWTADDKSFVEVAFDSYRRLNFYSFYYKLSTDVGIFDNNYLIELTDKLMFLYQKKFSDPIGEFEILKKTKNPFIWWQFPQENEYLFHFSENFYINILTDAFYDKLHFNLLYNTLNISLFKKKIISILLVWILTILLLFIIVILFYCKSEEESKIYALEGSIIVFIFSLLLWCNFDNTAISFQGVVELFKIDLFIINFSYLIGIDSISLFFILLTTLLIPICILTTWNTVTYRVKDYLIILLLIEFSLINIFIVLDLFLFYIYFESILIPMFILIGVWGSRDRKIHASYQFFLYTLISSLIMLLGICAIYSEVGTTNLLVLLYYCDFSKIFQLIVFFSFFIPFAVKVPMLPVHIWLPEAHVEAPTAGSVLLAGVLLKLGAYGIIRFVLPMFSYATIYYAPVIFLIACISIIYASFTTLRQSDLKKFIAYSSVAHMNFVMLGLFTNCSYGVGGSVYLMLSHGIVSAALFICIGLLYDRYKTRNLLYFSGLSDYMPIFTGIFLCFTLANIGLPGTSSFVGEFLIMMGVSTYNFVAVLLGCLTLIIGAGYALWFFNRISYGSATLTLKKIKNLNDNIETMKHFCDLNKREIYVLLPLILIMFFGGLYPHIFIQTFELAVIKSLPECSKYPDLFIDFTFLKKNKMN